VPASTPTARTRFLALTAKIVAAQLSQQHVPAGGLTALINEVYAALRGLDGTGSSASRQEPAVQPKRSISPDYIVCLEDGKKLKMLKRHLKAAYNMTPDEYRMKWGLPPDYPMVAPNYTRHRSSLARSSGLGKSRDKSG